MMRLLFSGLSILFLIAVQDVSAQSNLFDRPEFEKVSTSERADFQSRFGGTNWSGAGFSGPVSIDHIPTSEVRARLQKAFGAPTQKLDHLINRDNFRPGHYIQFEYWFVINDDIPLMILDVDGPFGYGLVYGGASRYIDMMPEIKRTLSEILMELDEPGEFQDYYYDLDNDEWYLTEYSNGVFNSERINQPDW